MSTNVAVVLVIGGLLCLFLWFMRRRSRKMKEWRQ